MTPLSTKLNQVFPGRVVRKDLVQRVKKGTNVPTFVLEFLLARYCATDDDDEIEAGLQAVNETIEGNFAAFLSSDFLVIAFGRAKHVMCC